MNLNKEEIKQLIRLRRMAISKMITNKPDTATFNDILNWNIRFDELDALLIMLDDNRSFKVLSETNWSTFN